MPQVIVRYDQWRISAECRKTLGLKLPVIVSEALDVPEKEEMRLTPNDIGVEFRPAGPDDILTHIVGITIEGNFYPERWENLKERESEITIRVAPLLERQISFYVYVKLFQAVFVEAKGTAVKVTRHKG
jgi:hypothetical protein